MTLKVGLIGAGRIGKVHAISIGASKNSEIAAVADVYEEAAQALAKEFGTRVASIDEILNDNTIDAILIASSTNTHADLIEAGVAAGKAIFCEKPIDLDLERARKSLEIAKGKTVMMGFNRRFDPNFMALKKAFDNGEIGKGELLNITSYDPAPPPVSYIKVSGGLFRDMTVHDFDIACWLFGEMPIKVTAKGACLVDPAIGEAGDIDTAVITLEFSGGRLAVIKNSRRAAYGYDQRIELLGSEGLLSAENVLESTVTKTTTVGMVSAKPEHFFLERYKRAYEIEWQSFAAAVLEGKALEADVQDGVNSLILADAAYTSYVEERTITI